MTRFSKAIALSLAALLLALGCGPDATAPKDLGSISLLVVSGNGQSGVVGTELPQPLVIKATNSKGTAIVDLTVNFRVTSGGGSMFAGVASTDGKGVAEDYWTLGTSTAQAQIVEVRAVLSTGQKQVFGVFTATTVPGSASQIAVNAGNNQSATVSTAVATAPSVIVRDQFNNAVSGVAVTFAVATGGGSLTGGSQTTNAAGIAAVGGWTVGQAAGPNTLTGTSTGLTGSPVTFTAIGTAGAATQIVANAGNNQTATVGMAVATPPSVIVRDQFNNPVNGVAVTFAVATGGGTLTGGSQTTNAAGVATAGSWTLGPTAGPNMLTASSTGLTGSPVTFTATGTTGAATQIATNAGDNQTAPVGMAVATPPSVIVRDQFNNPVSGVAVTFAVTTGGGSLTGGSQTTNAAGIATVGSWTLGSTAGQNTLMASSTGLTGSPVTFTAIGTTAAATQISATAGDNQSATVNVAVAVPPTVIVRDQFNNPVSGVAVTFAVATGGGSLTGGSQTTNATGIATVGSWTLGQAAGPNTLTAISTGLSGSPVTFTATGTPGAATRISINAGNNQSATVNTAVVTPPSVIVRDQFSNPVGGVAVNFDPATITGGGSLTGSNQITNAGGIATVGSWTLGQVAGVNTFLAFITGLGSAPPVGFTATGIAGAATQIALNAGDNQSAAVSTAVATAPSVIVRDQFNNPVSGVAVTFAVASGGGSVNPTSPLFTNISGIAQVTSWTLGPTVGPNILQATAPGLLGSPITFAAAASQLLYVANHSGSSITAYPSGASGNATPTVTIAGGNTGLSTPFGITRDGAGNIYVTNGGSITVYPAGTSGNATPTTTIQGSNTGLSHPDGIAVDGAGNIYVANEGNQTVTVYAAGASGNATPTATIQGSNTGLSFPRGIALDGAGNIYVVANGGSITVYPAGTSGNATPTTTISGVNSGLGSALGIALDGARNIYVTNESGSIVVFAAGASGNATPTATIAGGNTGLSRPIGIAVDGAGNIYVADYNTGKITVFAAGVSGNATPTATIAGGNTGLATPYFIAF